MKSLLQLILTGILMLCFATGVQAINKNPYAQSETLLQAIRDISERYNVHFTYDREIVENVEIKEYEPDAYANVDEALKNVLKGTKLKYVILEMKYVIIYQDDAAGMESLEQMVEVLKKIIEQKKEKRLVTSLDRLQSSTALSSIHLEKHRMVLNVSGTVTDQAGEPLIGVNIQVKGTNKGTATDFEGRFTLEDVNENTTLVFSYVGYQTQEFVLNGRSNINITMEEDLQTIDEVVVTGYTQQIKRKVISAVATVKTAELSDIPATSLGNAIAGRLAGVAITQDGGRPGRTSSINVRGATIKGFEGSSTPLYVIDGIVATKDRFDALDVSEVESVTALKDASATAQYGARASNGVILVQTKKGNGKPVINFTSTYGITEPTLTPEFTTPYEHGLLINSYLTFLNTDPLDSRYITQKELDFLKNVDYGSYAGQFAQNPVLSRNAVSIGGSNETVNYFMAGSKINQTAQFDNLTYDKYNIRAKLNVNLSERIKVGMNISTSRYQDEGFYWRYNGSDENYGDFYRTAIRQGRWAPAVKNGLYVANFNGWNAANIINNGAGKENRNNNITNILLTGSYKLPFIKGLTFSSVYNKNTTKHERKLFRQPLVSYTFATDPGNRFLLTDQVIGTRVRRDNGADSDSVLEGEEQTESYQLNFKLDYQNTFDDHTISIYSVYEQSEQDYKWFEGVGRGVTTELVQTFDGTTQGEQRTRGGLSETGRQSVIGGINYDFRGKYLLSTSFRYDGSVQFEKENRFGFFPSVSIGWIASDEPFIKNTLPFLDYLKFRYSVGKTGNDNIETDDFVYIQKYNIGTGAVFGTDEQITSSTVLGGLPVLGTTWESQTSNNFGLDFNLLRDRLQTSVDIFKSEKRNLFGTRQSFIPESSGLALLPENYGGIDISGFEILTSYRDHIGRDFTFEAGFNFGYAKSKYVNIDQPESTLPHLVLNDQFTDRVRTFVSEGIIRTQEQLDALPDNFTQFGRAPELGELLIRDIRGNAQEDPEGNTPDGKVDDNDRDYIEGSHSSPPINYGMRIAVKFKNFSLQAFAQGFAGHQRVFPQAARFTLAEAGESAWSIWNDSWAPNNPDASFPVYGGDQIYQYRESTFFMEDADFLRLKQLNLAYDTPERLLNVINVRSLRFFVNMDNLLMISRKIKVFDPETNGRGLPVNRSYSVGINLTF